MALDDFLTEDIEPVQPVELAEGDQLDEDLFDIPKTVASEAASAQVQAPAAEPVAKAEPSAPSGLNLDEDQFGFPKNEAEEAATSITEHAPQAPIATVGVSGGEIDLDEDLYDFSDPEDECLDNLVSLGNDLADLLDEVSSPPTPEEIEELASPGLAAELAAELDRVDVLAPAKNVRNPAPDAAAAQNDAWVAPSQTPALITSLQTIKQQPAWIAIVSVLAANFVLLFFAWSASRSLHAHLTQVREEIRQLPENPQETGAVNTAAAEPSANAADEAAARAEGEETRAERFAVLPHLPSDEEMSLRVAEREIADERFGPARRRLYGLLARVDGFTAETREMVEARALYLIGDTYARQAALVEDRP